MSIQIGSIGYNHSHDEKFRMDLPDGPGAHLFLLVRTAAVFYINARRHAVRKNSYVILRPDTPCFYKAAKDVYADDWFYFDMTANDRNRLLQEGILLDTPVFLGGADELSSLIHQLSYEHFSSDLFHDEIKAHLTEIFFYKLSRQVRTRAAAPDALSSKNDRLTYLRTRLFDEPALFANIDEMADFAGLSRSGFQHLYSKTFGTSVIHDVIAGRTERAKALLSRTDLTVSEIAAKCGYKSDFHFMRQFKQQTGLTPSEFRRGTEWLHLGHGR